MRTLTMTAALVTALTGTGCIVSSADPVVGDADLRWNFQDLDLNVAGSFRLGDTGCDVAAISHVNVTMEDSFGNLLVNASYDCVDVDGIPGAFVASLPVGRYFYTLEAWRVDAPVFYGQGNVDVLANQGVRRDTTLDVEAVVPLTVYFTQNGVRTCAPVGQAPTPQIRFDIFFPAASSSLLEPSTTIPCAGSNFGYTAGVDQAVGNSFGYDIFALDAGGVRVNDRCLQTVRHTGFPVTIDLRPAPDASCL